MKRKYIITFAIVLAIALSAVLAYQAGSRAAHERCIEEKEALCVNALAEAERWFSEWQETRSNSAYQRGILSFGNFACIYETLGEEDVNIALLSANTYYDFQSALLSRPSASQAHMEEILEAIAVLKSDLHDTNTYRMFHTLSDEIEVETE